jgi:hydrogenase maturation factor HypF (carbamoyltransferase family)
MAFIFELEYISGHSYILRYIEALSKQSGVEVSLIQSNDKITIMADENDPKLADFLKVLGETLPVSLFMRGSEYRVDDIPLIKAESKSSFSIPHSIGLCPVCQKELFDPSSRRYYYPFTSCNCCGPQYPLTEGYPFRRENSLLRFFMPCKACEEEILSNPFRRDYQLISCHTCGVAVKMRDRFSERYANDAGSFKTLFEVIAKAIKDGKSVRVKTLMGDRLFFNANRECDFANKRLMVVDAGKIESFCSVIREEIGSLLSIERPIIDVAIRDQELQKFYGGTATVKYPDDGFSLLLAKELTYIGFSYVGYVECSSNQSADYIVDYDLQIEPQSDMRYFINRDFRFIVEGERVSFPMILKRHTNRVGIANGLAFVPYYGSVLIDRVERMNSVEAEELYVLDSEANVPEHPKTVRFDQESALFLSVLQEYQLLDKRAVGVYFNIVPIFLYHNGKKPIVVVPSIKFDSSKLRENLATLREGSDRLVENFSKKFPKRAERLFSTDAVEDIFEVTALIMGLENLGFEAVAKEALAFIGKGGLQIDTKLSDNRFDPYAFIASIMSYKLADVPTRVLAYSIFESFGDYVTEILLELKQSSKADHIVLCGKAFGQQSLFSRIQRNLANEKFLINRRTPIGKESAILGALAL